MKQCKGCQRLKPNGECAVLEPKPARCWAYTTDPEWGAKVMKDTRRYGEYKKGSIGQYWRW